MPEKTFSIIVGMISGVASMALEPFEWRGYKWFIAALFAHILFAGIVVYFFSDPAIWAIESTMKINVPDSVRQMIAVTMALSAKPILMLAKTAAPALVENLIQRWKK